MEQNTPLENNRKIGNPEIQAAINQGEKDVQEIENLLKESLQDLKEVIDTLDTDIAYLEHMRGNNEFIEEYKSETGSEPSIKKYGEEEITKVASDIEQGKKTIAEINDFMTTLTLNKIETEDYVEEFKKLEESFRTLVLRIDPTQIN